MESVIETIRQFPLPIKAIENICKILAGKDSEKFGVYDMEVLGVSIANVFSQSGDYKLASTLFKKYRYYTKAAEALRILGRRDEAKTLIGRLFESFDVYRNSIYDMDTLVAETRKLLSPSELEELLVDGFEKFGKKYKRTDDLNYKEHLQLFKALAAKEKEEEGKVKRIYNESRRRIAKQKKIINRGSETDYVEEQYLNLDGLNSSHAILCSFIGKEEEAIKTYLHSIMNFRILNERFAPFLEKMDRSMLKMEYEQILRNSFAFCAPPDHYSAARAAEKLGRNEEAKEHYQKALTKAEERLSLGFAFEIAKKLNLEEKMKLYQGLAYDLYRGGFV